MKNFFKKYLWVIIYFVLSFIIFALTSIWVGFMVIGSFMLGAGLLFFGFKMKKKYNVAKDYSNEDDYFDATKLDYDEDIYYIGTQKSIKKQIGKNAVSKFNALMPTITLFLLGIGFIIMGITGILKIFLGL